jgi:hypothetical protein
MNYLKIDEMKPFYTYKINARNGRVGIWRPKTQDFLLKRTKFYNTFTFGEFHYDTGAPFGTARPIEELEQSPFTEDDLHSRTMTWEEAGREKPDWAIKQKVETILTKTKELEILNYLQEWEDKMDIPHPRRTL